MLPQLNLPEFSFKVKSDGQRKYIFDNIRKRYVVLTPEEWVRQNFIAYLINEKKYPASLIAVEMPLKINRLKKRADIVLFSGLGLPMIIVECKAPGVKITQKVFDQAALYNLDLKVGHLIVSNGMVHYCAELNHNERKWELLPEIPEFRSAK
ncbi:MAG: type I restriction enzyme HsdR N-terminal domain-containing protein [Bacteroidales bacterium]